MYISEKQVKVVSHSKDPEGSSSIQHSRILR
jgi:hypothetical protein